MNESYDEKIKQTFFSSKLYALPSYAIEHIDGEELICFLHIPKTGGSNLDLLAKALFHEDAVHIKAKVRQNKSPNHTNLDYQGSLPLIKDILKDNLDYFDNAKYITGHVPF